MTDSETNAPDSTPESEASTPAKKPVKKTAKKAVKRETVAAPAPAAAAPIVPAERKKGGGVLGILAILIALAALAGSAYTWYENQVTRVAQNSKLQAGVSDIGSQVARIGDMVARLQKDQSNVVTQASLRERATAIETAVAEQIRAVQDRQQELDESIETLTSDMQRGSNQYVVDEVSHLLRIANNNVVFGSDTESAINALVLADGLLKSLTDPRYSVVRTKINEEISALRNVALPDLESLSGTLRTIAKSVPNLPLANEPEQQQTTFNQAPAESAAGWRGALKEFWGDIVNQINIQRVDQPPKPLLAPEQRYFLNQNLQLMLAKAELALLQGQGQVFESGITDATTWLQEYFDLNDPTVSSVLDQLNEAANQSLNADLPVVTGSFELLQNIQGGQ
ncbi:MAG: uroporphyrinogen-III C-methyltransferase [Pseudomonadota bacterium]